MEKQISLKANRGVHVFKILFPLIFFVMMSIVPSTLHADPLDNWHGRNPAPTGNDLNQVTYGNNIFVAVGASGTIITSADGITWTVRNSGTTNALNGIVYGGSFVVVGASGTIITSADGITWTARTSGTANALAGVAYGNGTFVAVGASGTALSSADGITWTTRVSGTANALNGATYANSTFVVAGASGTVLTSANGAAWAAQVSGTTKDLNGVIFGGSNFVTVGSSGTVRISADGITWSSTSPGTTNALNGVTYGGNSFVSVGISGTAQTSPDGFTWTERSPGTSNTLNGAAYGGNIYVAVGISGTILTSPDGIAWTSRGAGVPSLLNGVIYGGNAFVAVGASGAVRTSADGVAWTTRSSGSGNMMKGVTYGKNAFVAVGSSGTVLTSSDGITWTSRTSGTANALHSVTYGRDMYMAVGDSDTVITSADGITWTGGNSGTSIALYGVIHGNGLYVVVGASGAVKSSTDGNVWVSSDSGTTNTLNAITYGNNLFVATGNSGTIITSSDGVTWTRRISGTTSSLNGVAYGNNAFVASGYSGAMVTSPDGITWTSRSSGTAKSLNSAAFGNNTFVAAGESDVIIQSDSLPAPPFLGNIPAPAVSDSGAVRITNTSGSSVDVKGTLYSQSGAVLGNANATLMGSLAANETRRLTPSDLANAVGVSTWDGGARLEITSPGSGIVLMGTYRAYSGTMTNMSKGAAINVYNITGSGNADKTYIRITNTSGTSSAQVKGTLYHKSGAVLGAADSILVNSLAPKETKVLSASDIEGLVGTSPWTNRGRLEITSPTSGLVVMGVIRTASGTLENMSPAITDNKAYHIPGSATSDMGYVRITNTTDSSVQVTGTLYKLDGTVAGIADSILVGSLASKETAILSAASLEGLVGSPPSSSSFRLEVTSPASGLVIMGWVMNATGDLVNMSETAASDLYFVPGSGSVDAVYIRITNTTGAAVQLKGTVYGPDGTVKGTANSVLMSSVPAKGTSRLTVTDLGTRVGADLTSGNYRLKITSPSSGIILMGTMRNATGTLTNMTGSLGY